MEKIELNEINNEAIQLFQSGYICAEAVLKTILVSFDSDPEIRNQICCVATGFGGGVARHGYICGAISGGIMSIGAIISHEGKLRRPEDKEKRLEIYKIAQNLMTSFESKFGSVMCFQLTNCDLKTEEGLKEYYKDHLNKKICEPIVGWTATEVFNNLISNKKS
ncbi:MAG: C-GCAxxG-C-C family protein [Candidatus Hodarchaeales archaeon]|jgi:C_GCAxxG_C_C family probable redox protein